MALVREFQYLDTQVTKLLDFTENVTGNSGLIRYRCDTDPAYHGYISFNIGNNSIDIIYIEAYPHRTGLGALLIFLIAEKAIFKTPRPQIQVTLPAQSETNFYKNMGFYPNQQEMNQYFSYGKETGVIAPHIPSPPRINTGYIKNTLHLGVGNWDSMTNIVYANTNENVRNKWIKQNEVTY